MATETLSDIDMFLDPFLIFYKVLKEKPFYILNKRYLVPRDGKVKVFIFLIIALIIAIGIEFMIDEIFGWNNMLEDIVVIFSGAPFKTTLDAVIDLIFFGIDFTIAYFLLIAGKLVKNISLKI